MAKPSVLERFGLVAIWLKQIQLGCGVKIKLEVVNFENLSAILPARQQHPSELGEDFVTSRAMMQAEAEALFTMYDSLFR